MKARSFLGFFLVTGMLGGCGQKELQNDKPLQMGAALQQFEPMNGEYGSWLQGFSEKPCTQNLPTLEANLVEIAIKNPDVHTFYKTISALNLNCQSSSPQYYKDLATKILEERGELRKQRIDLVNHAQMLNVLAEDTLHALYFKFGKEKLGGSIFAAIPVANDSTCPTEQTYTYDAEGNKMDLCKGDILVGKYPTPRSSLLSNILDYQGNFSHSLIFSLTQEKEPQIIESLIEDGVRLHKMSDYFYPYDFTRFHVYRYFASSEKSVPTAEHRKTTVAAVDEFVREIYQRSGNRPYEVSAWPYDMDLDVDNNDAMYCSEIIYYMYNKTSLQDSEKPFAKNTYNKIHPFVKTLATGIMGIKGGDKLVSPSDIERNENYALVGAYYNLEHVQSERIYSIFANVFIEAINNNNAIIGPIAKYIGSLSKVDKTVLISKIEKILSSPMGRVPYVAKLLQQTKTQISEKVPDGIGLSQAAFILVYSDLSERVVKAMIEKENKSGKPMSRETLHNLIKSHYFPVSLAGISGYLQSISEKITSYLPWQSEKAIDK